MTEKEKHLFKELCKFKSDSMDKSLIEFASPSVLGHLFFNRMQGIAYGVLMKNQLLGKINREFRNSLASAYEQNVQKNQSFYKCIEMLSKLLSTCNSKIAMLKGAYLCGHYPKGYRTSNDVDLLVLPQDVTTVGALLSNVGFQQGYIKNGEFVPATRQEIIESKMMRGETVPYIMEVNLPFLKYFEVDINFSLDYKNGDSSVLLELLSGIQIKSENNLSIPVLADEDFFVHLCAHLYKEATTLPWIEMNRDMTLYKYCDIYLLLSEMANEDLRKVFHRAKELGMEKICAYAILETMELFDMEHTLAAHMATLALANDSDFRLNVISPKEKKMLKYCTANVNARFFMDTRMSDLMEVKSDEKA